MSTPEEPKPDPLEGSGESEKKKKRARDGSFPKRYILSIMIFLGIVTLYALRVNLNVAITAMCNNHTFTQSGGFAVTKVPITLLLGYHYDCLIPLVAHCLLSTWVFCCTE